MNNNLTFYSISKNDCDKPYACFEYNIRWNIESISNQKFANGYIVQYVVNENNTGINGISEQPYYEAWKVENGIAIETQTQEYDDSFSWGGFFERNQIEKSIGKKGEVVYKTKVFWVNKSNPLCEEIEKWNESEIFYAGNIKAVYETKCDFLANQPVVFERYFKHIVDFDSKEKIKNGLLKYKKTSVLSSAEWKEWINELLLETPYKEIIKDLL